MTTLESNQNRMLFAQPREMALRLFNIPQYGQEVFIPDMLYQVVARSLTSAVSGSE